MRLRKTISFSWMFWNYPSMIIWPCWWRINSLSVVFFLWAFDETRRWFFCTAIIRSAIRKRFSDSRTTCNLESMIYPFFWRAIALSRIWKILRQSQFWDNISKVVFLESWIQYTIELLLVKKSKKIYSFSPTVEPCCNNIRILGIRE